METFDLAQTQRLTDLEAIAPEQRDDGWRCSLFDAVPNASLASFDPQVEMGPDGFPYFQLAIPDPGPFTPFSLVHLLKDFLKNGVGAVIHSSTRRDGPPLWVFTHGDLLSYHLFQDFSGDPKIYRVAEPPPAKDADRTILRAVPSEAYFPAASRAALGRFMRGPFRHPGPRMGLVEGSSLRPRRSLMVNLRARDYGGDRKKLDSAMRYLSWFVPKTYSIMALPDDWSDGDMSPI
jgi:hypothetical protein